MTRDFSDKIAEKVLSLPRMFDTPPKFSELDFPRSEGYPWGKPISNIRNRPVYSVAYGFGTAYTGEISQWKKTKYNPLGSYYGKRYVTIDDIRMFLYIGTEYAKRKMYGFRFRYDSNELDASNYPQGYKTRVPSGMRYIKRTGKGSGGEPEETRYYGSNPYWSPVKRIAYYSVPEIQGITQALEASEFLELPEDYSPILNEPVSSFVKIGTMAGDDDICLFQSLNTTDINPASSPIPQNVTDEYEFPIKTGNYAILLSLDDRMDEPNIDKSIIVYQKKKENAGWIFLRTPNSPWEYQYPQVGYPRTAWGVKEVFTSQRYEGKIALKKGVSYSIYAKFDEAVFSSYISKTSEVVRYRGLCRVQRIKTSTKMPRFLPS